MRLSLDAFMHASRLTDSDVSGPPGLHAPPCRLRASYECACAGWGRLIIGLCVRRAMRWMGHGLLNSRGYLVVRGWAEPK